MEATDKGVEEPNWVGDRQLANVILWMRDGGWYWELCHAISDGDIGHVVEVLKVSDKF